MNHNAKRDKQAADLHRWWWCLLGALLLLGGCTHSQKVAHGTWGGPGPVAPRTDRMVPAVAEANDVPDWARRERLSSRHRRQSQERELRAATRWSSANAVGGPPQAPSSRQPTRDLRLAKRNPGMGIPQGLRGHFPRADPADLEELLRQGRDPNCTIDSKVPPLCRTADHDWVEGADLLLRYGARLEARDPAGLTALGHAIESDLRRATTFLLQRGANPRIASPEFKTSLGLAAERGSIRALRALLEHGCNPNETGQRRATALMVAARAGDIDVAEELLRAGAKPQLRDAEGWSARDYAVEYQRQEFLAWYDRRVRSEGQAPLLLHRESRPRLRFLRNK